MTHKALIVALVLGLGTASTACQDEERCERARLATASEWEKLKNEAGRFKYQGVSGYEEMNAAQKTNHLEVFTTIESQSELVFESFAFKRISWTTGTKARDRVVKEFNGYFAKDKYVGFKGLLDSAQKRFSEAEAACR